MRKPRDIDSELKALAERAKQLKERRVQQLGELVIATGGDAMDAETLTGALLGAAKNKDAKEREAWRTTGAAFFRGQSRATGGGPQANTGSNQSEQGDGQPR